MARFFIPSEMERGSAGRLVLIDKKKLVQLGTQVSLSGNFSRFPFN